MNTNITKKKTLVLPLTIILVILIVILFVLMQSVYSTATNTTAPVTNNPVVNNEEPEPLTEEEQLQALDELAPQDPVDTPEERQEQVDLLDQLMAQ